MNLPKLTIVKIGGNVIDNSANLYQFLKNFSALQGAKILVHGGGKVASELASTMGIEPVMVDGRRVTDIETLRIVTMVYAGLINKNLVAQLQLHKTNAIGLSGADANSIKTTKRPLKNGVDFGFVGDVFSESVNTNSLTSLLNAELVPVFSAITHDGEGQLLNTNADTIASALARALANSYEVKLVYCFEKKGVLRDANDPESVIAEINAMSYDALKNEGIVAGGMIPKIENALDAVQEGVHAVYICSAEDLTTFDIQKSGTKITV